MDGNSKQKPSWLRALAAAFICGIGVESAYATVWSYWNHEPADHLRRMGYTNPSVFTIGEWLPQWYDRLHGEELISKAAKLGVDTVYCHFFKGFGLRHERDEMMRTKAFAKTAHAHGVKVLGYCQLDSLYYEAMLDEVPDLETWTARRPDGSVATYGEGKVSHDYRWSPCIESAEFRDYIRKVVGFGIEEVGLDGFYFDNSYARDCHCDRCQAAFRKFLDAAVANPRETCGLSSFRHVRIPPRQVQDAAGQECHDPMQLWRQRFRHARLAEFHRAVFGFVKQFGRDKLVMHNPAYGRTDFELKSLDVSIEPKSCDFMMAENGRFIHAEPDGSLVTQAATYKLGRTFGFKVIESSWRRVADAGRMRSDMPHDADSISRFYAQAMIYGDIVGSQWLMRTAKKGRSVILDDPLQFDAAGKAFRFFRANKARLYDTASVSKVHVLYATDTFYGWNYNAMGFHSFVDATERLNAATVPYVICTEDDLPTHKPGELLVLPDVRFLSRRLYGAIADAGNRGVKVLPLGFAGLYDENGKERAKDDPVVGLSLVANKVVDVPAEFMVETSERGIMAETQVNARGEFVLHLLRPGNTSTIGELRVAIGDERTASSAELFSFEDGCALGDVRRDESGRVVLTVCNFRTMCSIVFGLPSRNDWRSRSR